MPRSPVVLEPEPSSLAEHGLDETWMERWVQEQPRRLGLGPDVRIVRAQVQRTAAHGQAGRLDLQAVDSTVEERVYDIELMRGELDADHGFRALDYWAREQKADEEGREHRPVIVAERILRSRYRALLEVLSERLGLIAIEVRCVKVDGQPTVWLEPVILPEKLRPDHTGAVRTVQGGRTEEDWRASTTQPFQNFLGKLREAMKSWGLRHRAEWSAVSYVGLWKGSRCWCPVWPRKDAAGRVYLPLPASWGAGDQNEPPAEFELARTELEEKAGIKLAWAWGYNTGANPIGATIRPDHLDKDVVRKLFEESWRAL